MRYLIYTDPHLCESLSIVRGRGERFSYRLENLIKAFKFINQTAKDNQCDKIYCLGDLAENNILTAEEISALSECYLREHAFVVGNHDMSTSEFNVCNMYKEVYYEPHAVSYPDHNLLILPFNREMLDLNELTAHLPKDRPTVIFSHNDVKGVNYGSIASKVGYEVADILANCQLFINGHIHVGKWVVNNRILNLGTVAGMNFNCLGAQWNPSFIILDTKDMSIQFIENPYSYLFHKIDVAPERIIDELNKLDASRENVVQIRVPLPIVDVVNQLLDEKNIQFRRVITYSYDNYSHQRQEEIRDFTKSESVFDSLRKFIMTKCDDEKYDKNNLLDEVRILEEI